ncbi:MAG TPA: glycosyltransferase [Flavobacteriales bacterium]|nr:glycosyltransferase [Flavobacteriales bacterium]
MSAIALWVLIGALVVLFLYQALIFSRLAFLRPKVEPDRDTPVSVVICARNAMQDLEELVPLLMDQDHGEFEVVVVNDRSDDDTWELLQWLKLEHPRLKPVDLQADEKFSYGKKMALGVGIRSAKHPHILLTDADCRPAGRDWISTMAAGFHNGKELVVAHSPYEHRPGLTNLLERYDGLAKAVQYLAFAKAGLPYMGVGRNLGYTKAVFANAKGQLRHRHLMSGDDDLFVNEVARRGNTAVVVDPRSFMTTRATEGLLAWVRRRRRHFTTASHYRFGHQVLLFLLPLARVAFWVAIVALFLLGRPQEAWIGLGVKVLLFQPITMLAMNNLLGGTLIWWSLPLEAVFLLLDPAIYFSTLISKPRRWK